MPSRECGRKLASHVRARAHADHEMKRRSLFEKYIPEVASAIGAILGVERTRSRSRSSRPSPTS